MAANTAQFVHQAQEANRSIVNALQGIAGVQSDIVQRLAGIQQGVFNQACEATNEQFQLVGRVRDPREFASAQAELVKRHGQRYTDSIKQAVDVVAEAWEAYGDRLEQGIDRTTDKVQRATKKAA